MSDVWLEIEARRAGERRDRDLERRAREGKRPFVVTETTTRRFRVWADSAHSAEEELFWMRSSQRPFPTVEPLDPEPQTTRSAEQL
jgi:hypothetical protein